MNKNQRMLYLSGLISEEQFEEGTDFEYSMAMAQKMRGDFERLAGALENCLESSRALEKQAMNYHSHHDKTGSDRLDSNGIGDVNYFEAVSEAMSILTQSIGRLFGHRKPIGDVEENIEALLARLEADFDHT